MADKIYEKYNSYKIGDLIFYLDHYTIKPAMIQEIFYGEDYCGEDLYVKHTKGCSRFSDINHEAKYLDYRIKEKQRSYDHYITRGY